VADDRGDAPGAKEMCFSVAREVLEDVVALCGYQVFDTDSSTEAPDWVAPAPSEEGLARGLAGI
jgi:hypothetical protein